MLVPDGHGCLISVSYWASPRSPVVAGALLAPVSFNDKGISAGTGPPLSGLSGAPNDPSIKETGGHSSPRSDATRSGNRQPVIGLIGRAFGKRHRELELLRARRDGCLVNVNRRSDRLRRGWVGKRRTKYGAVLAFLGADVELSYCFHRESSITDTSAYSSPTIRGLDSAHCDDILDAKMRPDRRSGAKSRVSADPQITLTLYRRA